MSACTHRRRFVVTAGQGSLNIVYGRTQFSARSLSVCRTCGAVRIGKTTWAAPTRAATKGGAT